MTNEKNEDAYPVRTIHDFVFEIQKEWGKFKTGALVTILTSSVLLIVFVLVFIRTIQDGLGVSGIILELLLAAFLLYGLYLMNFQYRFFRKWEKRMNRLSLLEEKLMPEKNEENSAPDKP
jgi:Na+-driven multidrug efflux pump